jgi:hypothetical protein
MDALAKIGKTAATRLERRNPLKSPYIDMLKHTPVKHICWYVSTTTFLLQRGETLQDDVFTGGETISHIRGISMRIVGTQVRCSVPLHEGQCRLPVRAGCDHEAYPTLQTGLLILLAALVPLRGRPFGVLTLRASEQSRDANFASDSPVA